MPSTKIPTLSDAQRKALYEQMKAEEAQEREAAKALRAEAKTITGKFVAALVASDVPEQTFESTAVGYSTGGKFEVDGRTYRVSVLIRDEATIPPKEA
jgi:predicted O-methyltransferase YrrM